MNESLLFRTDASSQIGTGHVMRCLALAQAWQDGGGTAYFAMSNTPEGIATRLGSEHCGIETVHAEPGCTDDAEETVALCKACHAAWLVVDGYQFSSAYQKFLKDAGIRVMWIDDYGHAAPYTADVVLNQNISAREEMYRPRDPSTRLLLGTQYAMLRREFYSRRSKIREFPEHARRILVTMGGGDPDNVTMKVIEAIDMMPVDGIESVIVVGASNPHFPTLQAAVQRSSHNIRLQHNVANMHELMAWADVAVAAGGSTSWELASMGLPTLIVVLAENQRGIAEALQRLDVSRNLGFHTMIATASVRHALSELLADKTQRERMSKAGLELVDGRGSGRVVKVLAAKSRNVHEKVMQQ